MAASQGSDLMNQTSLTLDGDRGMRIERVFNAPPRIVYEAITKPELVRRWWAPKSLGVTVVSCEADVRVGGKYRYVFSARGGPHMAFSGTYSEVKANSRLVNTEFFEPTAGGVQPGDQPAIVTVTLEDLGGKTRLVSHSLYASKEVRDMVLATGMETGMRESYDQLDELVESLN